MCAYVYTVCVGVYLCTVYICVCVFIYIYLFYKSFSGVCEVWILYNILYDQVICDGFVWFKKPDSTEVAEPEGSLNGPTESERPQHIFQEGAKEGQVSRHQHANILCVFSSCLLFRFITDHIVKARIILSFFILSLPAVLQRHLLLPELKRTK